MEEAERMCVPYLPSVVHSHHNQITRNIENAASMEPTPLTPAANQLVVTMIGSSLESDSSLSLLEVQFY